MTLSNVAIDTGRKRLITHGNPCPYTPMKNTS